MKAVRPLPEGYREILHIDLQKDKKTALKVNIASFAVGLAMVLLANIRVPIRSFFSGGLVPLLVYPAAYAAYIVLHELTHACVMRAVGGGKLRFGFTGMYAYAGTSEDCFDKSSYRCIALAPLVVWGAVFLALQFLLPEKWFWTVWLLQIGNVAGAAGDVYVTAKLWRMPAGILVRDTGLEMTVYGR